MIKKWKDQGSTASHFFHPHTKKEGPNDQFTKNLWVHQQQWQKELMCNYRKSITLIDATYKTTQYDLPLCLSAYVQMWATALSLSLKLSLKLQVLLGKL